MNGRIDSEEITLDSGEALAKIALEMVLNCRRTLDISSRHLDPEIYDNDPFVAAVKRIALGSRLARIRLLITDVRPVVGRGHRLLDLSSRLSSFISIRKPGRDYQHFNEALLLADNTAYIHRRFADRYDGIANHNDMQHAGELAGRFEELWERAETDPNFRRLHI